MAFGDGPADESLRDAWSRFCDQLKEAGDSVFKDANPGAPMMRADAFRFLTQNLGQAFDLALETRDPAFPQIHPLCTPTRKLGGDVADFTYRQAWIDGNHTYKITGKRGTARWLNVTVQGPRPEKIPGTDWPSLHEPFGDIPETNIFGHQLRTDDEGHFELYVGGRGTRRRTGCPPRRAAESCSSARLSTPGSKRRPHCPSNGSGWTAPRPIPNSNAMVEAMDWAGDFLTGAMRDWPEHSWRHSGGVCDPAFTNQFPPDKIADADSDAKRGRMAAHMVWALKPDEALIVEMDNHDGFWIFGMGGVFVGSMDFLYRAVSYTPARTVVDSDDVVRFVIAHDDPGVHNWLDSQGFSNGNLTYRNLESQHPADVPHSTRQSGRRARHVAARYRHGRKGRACAAATRPLSQRQTALRHLASRGRARRRGHRNRRHEFAGGQEAVQVLQCQRFHRGTGLHGATGHVRQQHHIVQLEQSVGHVRFVDEHVQARPGQSSGGQGLDQGGLVDDAAAGHVDQIPVRPERRDDVGVHQMPGAVSARGGDDQHVDRCGEFDRRRPRRRTGSPATGRRLW